MFFCCWNPLTSTSHRSFAILPYFHLQIFVKLAPCHFFRPIVTRLITKLLKWRNNFTMTEKAWGQVYDDLKIKMAEETRGALSKQPNCIVKRQNKRFRQKGQHTHPKRFENCFYSMILISLTVSYVTRNVNSGYNTWGNRKCPWPRINNFQGLPGLAEFLMFH